MTGAFHVASDAGEARWWGSGLAVIKATADRTDGRLSVMEITEAPGYEAPLHVHHGEDEAFYVLDGELTFEVGGDEFPAAPGDFVFGPRGVPHRYRVGPAGCRLLFVLTPGGFEAVVRAMSVPAGARELPDREHGVPDGEAAFAAAARHGVEALDG
jgi:quercetin dioxygenase-like cupin family protein